MLNRFKYAGFEFPESDFKHDPPKWFKHARIMIGLCMKHVKGRQMAVDVGANCGVWTAKMMPLFERVLAFEPIDENYACLVKNISGTNVVAHHLALGANIGVVNMGLHGAHYGHVIMQAKSFEEIEQAAGVVPLDSFCLEACDLLKIDVDGYEFAVLMGAKKTIMDHHPVICIEMGKGTKDESEDIRKELVSMGYHLEQWKRPDEVWVHAN